ncbi:hypothetical protein A4V15_22475 [Pseudomonas oryzihabitans]|uniref:Uncharacterized protein n=1 Tax=Pseudomonas oryzihabitans TaxID=47885 RepID=A0A178LC83_9PSED|nr:hypothetical protein A4V15_22475 [Pseudomonas oryzihabitans]
MKRKRARVETDRGIVANGCQDTVGESVLKQMVIAEIASIGEAIGRIRANRVRVRTGRSSADLATRPALVIDGLATEQVTAIGGAEQPTATAIRGQVGETFRQRCLPGRRQTAGAAVDMITLHCIGLAAQRRVERLAIRAQCKRVNLHTSLCLVQQLQRASFVVEPIV